MSVPVTLPVREVVPQRVTVEQKTSPLPASLAGCCSLAGLSACEERFSLYLFPRCTICEVS